MSALRTLEQDRVAKSAVPVLLLSNIRDFVEPRVIVEDMYYSAFFKDGTQSISVQGSRLTTKYADLRAESNIAKKRIRSTDGFITESEAIWTASWKEFGAAYVLSVECAKAKDKRCESEDHLTKLANSLVYVGGGRITAENRPLILPDQPEVTSTFTYNPPGQLRPGSGTGRQDNTVYSPDMRFPIENKPAYANSQVYNPGGNLGPPGGQ